MINYQKLPEPEILNDTAEKIEFDFEDSEVKLLRYPAGTEIPAHSHKQETLHVILKGKIRMDNPEIILDKTYFYKCGGYEYGPWQVLEDFEMLVISPKQ